MKCQNHWDYCGKEVVVFVSVNGAELWLCDDCYEQAAEAQNVIILDDVDSRNERIMQDRMRGGR